MEILFVVSSHFIVSHKLPYLPDVRAGYDVRAVFKAGISMPRRAHSLF